jgi:N-acetylneuraminic acid mutarotase
MPTAVVNAASVAMNGRLYVFAGNNGTNDVSTLQVYDPHKNKWTTVLPSLPTALSSSSAVVVYGPAFVEGGDNGSAEISIPRSVCRFRNPVRQKRWIE